MHLHNELTILLVSPTNADIVKALKNHNINVCFSDCIEDFIEYEKYHADMQLLRIRDKYFVPQNACGIIKFLTKNDFDVKVCESLGRKYPRNVSLNAALVGDKLFCKESTLAKEVKEYCLQNGISIVNVNQGYAKCSTLIIDDNAIITSDPSIYKAAIAENVDVLLISQGNIVLDENNYGFIGGASGVIGEKVLFFGDLDMHPDRELIKEFIEKYNKQVISLINGVKLCDIGGFVLIN